MKDNKCFFVLVALLSTLILSGCGSSGGSGGDQTASPAADELGVEVTTGIDYVGADNCIGCHEGFSWSADAVSDYLAGAHVVHSDHITASNAVDGCLECHDPIGDGTTVGAFIAASDVPEAGLAAVTCEACHGAGGEHYGVGPIPNPLPGSDVCGQCHNTLPESHLPHHPDADTIYEKYAGSAHAGSAGPDRSEYSTDEDMLNGHMGDHLPFGHSCVKCHTHEGAIEYLEVDDEAVVAVIDDGADNSYTSIQCKTCHDSHEAGKLLEPAVHEEHPVYAEDGSLDHLEETTISSAQYNTCDNCHSMEGFHLTKNVAWSMLETHFDDETTVDIEGYVIDKTAEDSCSACHDIHSSNNEINDQWAQSGHAAEIALVKEEHGPDAVISMDDEHERHSVIAFTEINFAMTPGRETCQRCHTTTGSHNYLTAQGDDDVTYDPANNSFSHLEAVYDEAGDLVSSKVEFITCAACHTSATTGELITSGSDITLDYTYNNEAIVLEGVNQSELCFNCHGGWGNHDSLVAMPDDARDFHGVLHHGPAGAILFAEQTHAGYEFPGKVYRSTGHDKIGTVDADGNEVVPGTGTAGPCVACHMPDNNHSNIVNDVASITSQSTCNACHLGGTMTADILTAGNAGRADTASLIRSYIDATYGIKGVAASTVPAEYFRAAMNWWVVYDDLGGHAHNPTYVKQIAFDTIDYLADGVLDGTITIDVVAWPEAAAWLGANLTTGVTTRL